MSACRRLRPALLRAADGDASPADALRVARHLAGCTTCRIVAYRERRLRVALDDLEDAPADDAFLTRVMESLPATPPPPPIGVEARRLAWLRRRRRILGLALLLAGGGAAATHAAGAWAVGPGSPVPTLAALAEAGSALGALVLALLTSTDPAAPGVLATPHLGVPSSIAVGASLLLAGTLAVGAAAALGLRRRLAAAGSR